MTTMSLVSRWICSRNGAAELRISSRSDPADAFVEDYAGRNGAIEHVDAELPLGSLVVDARNAGRPLGPLRRRAAERGVAANRTPCSYEKYARRNLGAAADHFDKFYVDVSHPAPFSMDAILRRHPAWPPNAVSRSDHTDVSPFTSLVSRGAAE